MSVFEFGINVSIVLVVLAILLGVLLGVLGPCAHFLETGLFCSHCGAQIRELCPECGRVTSAAYCIDCGYSFVEGGD